MSFFQKYFYLFSNRFLCLNKIVPFSFQNMDDSPKVLIDANLLLLAAFVIGIGMFTFLLLYWLRTIAVYAEDEQGKMRYQERLWVSCKEEHFEVKITSHLLERCVTTHLCLKPDILFAELYKDKIICCLLPEGICIREKISRNVDIILL